MSSAQRTGLGKNLHQRVSSAYRARQRKAPVARKGDKLEMLAPVLADELVSHGEEAKVKTPTLQRREGRPPGIFTELSVLFMLIRGLLPWMLKVCVTVAPIGKDDFGTSPFSNCLINFAVLAG